MIGVIADPSEQDAVREFFELFKTPWEFYEVGRAYPVVLATMDGPIDAAAKLVVVYSGRKTRTDSEVGIAIGSESQQACTLIYEGRRLPVYGATVTFRDQGVCLLKKEASAECAALLQSSGSGVLARIGYDLFGEIRTLLTAGQPAANAAEPTLDLHIALLRQVLERASVPFVEIPPVPDGFKFIACLTHDVDHPSIRLHQWDHTAGGFLYRAIFGSLLRVLRGQIPIKTLFANWWAVAKLPFIYAGLVDDFWSQFDAAYDRVQGALPSTFFFIPRKGDPGKRAEGAAPAIRASRYAARELSATIQKLERRGDEIGLHGIDAWLDVASASSELAEIHGLTKRSEFGVRMHWLYFNQQSPAVLEKAGAAYDSTFGYNETVGYRGGTTQVFRPLGLQRMLELPLHAMDTALFYPSYLGCSPQQANQILARMVENVSRHGGALTLNWHDRSLAPERFWDASYEQVIELMKARGAWFATAGQAVAWFHKRRSVVFDTDSSRPDTFRATITCHRGEQTPGLRLRSYTATADATQPSSGDMASNFLEVRVEENANAGV